jgi:hypothetical protein
VHADLDTLVVALKVTIDELVGPRRGPGRPPKLSDAELICLAVAQVLLGVGSEPALLVSCGPAAFEQHPQGRTGVRRSTRSFTRRGRVP